MGTTRPLLSDDEDARPDPEQHDPAGTTLASSTERARSPRYRRIQSEPMRSPRRSMSRHARRGVLALVLLVVTASVVLYTEMKVNNPLKSILQQGFDISAIVGWNVTSMATDLSPVPAADHPTDSVNLDDEDEDDRPANEYDDDTPPTSKYLNIVLFYADDWTFHTLGKVNPVVKTPHLNEMADNGVLFRHNCVTTSICWQSRATMVTGQYVSVHQQFRVMDNALFRNWNQTLYPLLKSAGYHTGFVGKWHAPMPEEAEDQAFDYYVDYYGEHWMDRGGERRHVTDLNQQDALEYLRKHRPRDQKFMLTISFFATHAVDNEVFPNHYQPQPRTESLYSGMTIPEPKTATEEHWQRMPWFFDEELEGRIRWHERFSSPERYQTTMQSIYRMASEVDDVVGAIKEEIRELGEDDNTLFIFTTDNGVFHGEHGLAGKWWPFEESLRVPLIVEDPRLPKSKRGSSYDDFTLNIDLAPTILRAAGVDVPSAMQGRDMAELYLTSKEETDPWREDFFYEWKVSQYANASGHRMEGWVPSVFGLIRRDYKYFYWPVKDYEQVFHIEADPYEEDDLLNATSVTTTGILEDLKERYRLLMDKSRSGDRV